MTDMDTTYHRPNPARKYCERPNRSASAPANPLRDRELPRRLVVAPAPGGDARQPDQGLAAHARFVLDRAVALLGAVEVALHAVQVAELPVQEWALMLTLVEDVSMKTPLDTGGDSPPSAAVQVARCMVILV